MDEENIIYMKKGLVGWKQTDDQVEATHQLITIKEYRELTHQIKMLNKELDAVPEAIEEEIRKVSIDYSRQVREIENELEDYKAKANQEIKAAKEEIQKYKSLNENLLRISKERANADRKLKPKKEHSGYIVVSSQEKEIKYSKSKKTIIWETCIQTPYSVEFNESNVRTQINEKELFCENRGCHRHRRGAVLCAGPVCGNPQPGAQHHHLGAVRPAGLYVCGLRPHCRCPHRPDRPCPD